MKVWKKGVAGIAGCFLVMGVHLLMSLPAQALSAEQVNDIAYEVTVLIKGEKGHGSGLIVAKEGDLYSALTSCHVVKQPDTYKIVTTKDKQAYVLSSHDCLPGKDLAVVNFRSTKNYRVATLANSESLKVGSPVFISGWPASGSASPNQLVRQFTGGQVSAFLDQSVAGGYQISYTNITRGGMSGGPVFDAGGRVVGVHGLGDTEDPQRLVRQLKMSQQEAAQMAGFIKPGFNYAVPIKAFLQGKSQALALQVENSPPSGLQGELIGEAQPQKRDEIADINKTLDEAISVLGKADNIMRKVCGFLPFC